jgi:hypothetical protein
LFHFSHSPILLPPTHNNFFSPAIFELAQGWWALSCSHGQVPSGTSWLSQLDIGTRIKLVRSLGRGQDFRCSNLNFPD